MRATNEMPTFDALFEPLLAALQAFGGGSKTAEIYPEAIELKSINQMERTSAHMVKK
jgi:hypothetical protein